MTDKKKSKPANLPNKPTEQRGQKARQKPDDAAKHTIAENIELHPDAWERFEEGLKRAGKTKPYS